MFEGATADVSDALFSSSVRQTSNRADINRTELSADIKSLTVRTVGHLSQDLILTIINLSQIDLVNNKSVTISARLAQELRSMNKDLNIITSLTSVTSVITFIDTVSVRETNTIVARTSLGITLLANEFVSLVITRSTDAIAIVVTIDTGGSNTFITNASVDDTSISNGVVTGITRFAINSIVFSTVADGRTVGALADVGDTVFGAIGWI